MQANFKLTNNMDAARAFERYVSARIRVERLTSLLSRRCNSEEHLSHSRLPAGGRCPESETSVANSQCNNAREIASQTNCEYATAKSSCTSLPADNAKQSQKKSKSKFKVKCKYPVFLVRSKPNKPEDAVPDLRFKWSPLRRGTVRSDNPVRVSSKESNKSSRCPSRESVVRNRCPSGSRVEPTCSPSGATVKVTKCLSTIGIPAVSKVPRQVSKETIHCNECEKIPNISKELYTMNKKLEDQIASEVKHKEKLNALNEQLFQLCSTVKTLNEKCVALETEKQKIQIERVECECLKMEKDRRELERLYNLHRGAAQTANQKVDHLPDRKASSMCQFCHNKHLPVLNSMHCELFKMMDQRVFSEITLTILLRADNVYHVNVRDLETGRVLGCLLVSDAAIKEANNLGLFKEILTFCVIDVRNTISKKDCTFGGINFEFIRNQRLCGGNAISTKQQQQQEQQLQTTIFCLTEALKASRDTSLSTQANVSVVSIASPDKESCLVLTDYESKYPVQRLTVGSFLDSSSEDEENVSFYSSNQAN